MAATHAAFEHFVRTGRTDFIPIPALSGDEVDSILDDIVTTVIERLRNEGKNEAQIAEYLGISISCLRTIRHELRVRNRNAYI